MTQVQTCLGSRDPGELGTTLVHEHVFVRSPELDLNLPDPEWAEAEAVERAVSGFHRLHDLGVRTVVDLTVLGLGRDVRLVERVAEQVPVDIVVSTGYYTSDVLPPYFGTHGPGRLVDGPDPLVELFVRDIEEGIAGTTVRAGMLKVVTDEPGITEDVNYLRELMDNGSTIGMDRFGMEHVLPDERRVATVLELLRLGYADRMVLSHDAAFYSRVTPPSWRARHAPHWHLENIHRRILPMLEAGGATESDVHQILVANPRRILEPRHP